MNTSRIAALCALTVLTGCFGGAPEEAAGTMSSSVHPSQESSSTSSEEPYETFMHTRLHFSFRHPASTTIQAECMLPVEGQECIEQSDEISGSLGPDGFSVTAFTPETLEKCHASFLHPDDFRGLTLEEFAWKMLDINTTDDEKTRDDFATRLESTEFADSSAFAFTTVSGDSTPCGGQVSGGRQSYLISRNGTTTFLIRYRADQQQDMQPILDSFSFGA